MLLKCHNCGHSWNYTGKATRYATCSACHYRVRIDQQIARDLGVYGFGPEYSGNIPENKKAQCKVWIKKYIHPTKKINRIYSSYGLKHMVEEWNHQKGVNDPYIPNGAFIAAAIDMDYNYEVNGPNAYFNMNFEELKKDPVRSGLSAVSSIERDRAKEGCSRYAAECGYCKQILPKEEMLPTQEPYSNRKMYLCFDCVANMTNAGVKDNKSFCAWLYKDLRNHNF